MATMTMPAPQCGQTKVGGAGSAGAPSAVDGAPTGTCINWRTRARLALRLSFMKDASNIVFLGPNGVGKSTLAMNVAHQALVQGHTVLFATASQMLGELAGIDSDSTLRRRLRRYAQPDILVIDEVGYLSYSNRHADLYVIEAEIRGKPPHERRLVRQATTKPLLVDLERWLRTALEKLSRKSDTSAAIQYALNLWPALLRYCDDGRL